MRGDKKNKQDTNGIDDLTRRHTAAANTAIGTKSQPRKRPLPYIARKMQAISSMESPMIPESYEYEAAKCRVMGNREVTTIAFLNTGEIL